MDTLNNLPGDNSASIPLDPNKEEFKLPVESDEDFKLPIEESPLMLNYQSTMDIDPLKASKVINYSKRLNENPYVIEKNLDGVEKFINAPDSGFWMEYEKRNPKSAEFLKDTKNFAMAKNDIDKLADIEKTVQDQSFANDLWDGLQKGLASTNANIARIPSLAYNMAALPQNMAAKALGRPDLQVSAPESLINNPIANFYDKQTKAYSSSDASESISDQIGKGDYKNAAKNLAVQVVTNSPSQMISIVLGLSGAGLIPSLAVSGGIQGSGTLKESLDQGADPASSTLNAAYQGTFEAGMESLSFGTIGALRQSLTKAFGKESARKVILEFGKEITTSMASEGKEEFLTQIAQDFSSYATGVDTGALNGTLGRALDAGLIGAASGGAMNAPASAIASRTRLIQIKKTDVLKKQYSDLGKMAVSTELSKNSPDTQVAMISNLTEGTPVENIYLPVEQAQVYFQSKGLNLEAVGKEVGIENEVKEAVETGSDIKIPLAKWIAKLANTEHYEALKDDIKYSPEDFTARQNKDYNDEIFNLLDAENSIANENQKLSEDQKTQANVVYESLRDELVNRGQSSDVAEKNAKIYQSYVSIKAARDGISIAESDKDLRPTIVNGDSQPMQDSQVAAQGPLFQSPKEARSYIDTKLKSKAVVLSKDLEAPMAEFDKITGQLVINPSKVTSQDQVDQIISQFGETKRESITGKIETKIDGETVVIDARKAVNALAAKIYALERLSECSR